MISASDAFITTSTTELNVGVNNSSGVIKFGIGSTATEKMRIDSSGNVLVGGDSVTATSNPAKTYSKTGFGIISANDEHLGGIRLSSSTTNSMIIQADPDAARVNSFIAFEIDGNEDIRINSSGQVGIGTSSPAHLLHLAVDSGAGSPTIALERTDTTVSSTNTIGNIVFLAGEDGTEDTVAQISAVAEENFTSTSSATGIFFNTTPSGSTSSTERMRIDSSGTFMVAKTSASSNNVGFETSSTGNTAITRSGGQPLLLNRQTDDGNIILLRKNGSDVGSIGTDATDIYIGTTDTGIRFNDAVNGVLPYNTSTGTQTDATLDLGFSSVRWKDLYLSGGVYVGGTAAANHLDDYEEGTWTPVIRGAGVAGSYTYSLGYGVYTKIGRQVTISFFLQNITEVSAGTAYLQITGCPFTKAGSQSFIGAVNVQSVDWYNSNTYANLQFTTTAASSVLYVRLNGDNYAGSDLQISELVSGASDIAGTITFFV